MSHKYNVIQEDYFLWLCEKVCMDGPDKGYVTLMKILYERDFSPETAVLIPNDDNRIEDGIRLRDEFIEDFGLNGYIRGACSVLEMMVALSYRIEDIFGFDDAPGYFWMLLENLGLDLFDDHYCRTCRNYRGEIDDILYRFMNREYCKDGKGSLFPMKNPSRNLAKTEIWYQMQNYMREMNNL